MNINEIRELAAILKEMGLTVLEVSEGEKRVRLESGCAPAAPLAAPPVGETASAVPAAQDPGVDFNNLSEIHSPLVGVFYAAPSPEAEPFVRVGSQVRKGDVVCIVEAMKLMNEIVAEKDGTIVDVCAHNGDVVEYGQTLFKLS